MAANTPSLNISQMENNENTPIETIPSTSSLKNIIDQNSLLRYRQHTKKRRFNDFEKYTFKGGQAIQSQSQKMIANLLINYEEMYPTWTSKQLVNFTSKITGIGTSSIFKVQQKARKKEVLKTPGKHRDYTSRKRINKYDSFVQEAIRCKVHEYFKNQEVPYLKKVHKALVDDGSIPPISMKSLRLLLHDIGFKFMRRKRNAAIIEREDILIWRRKYLRTIRQHRKSGKKIYYLDETWVNAGECTDLELVDTTILSSKDDAVLQGLSTGKKLPTSKAGHVIIGHVGSDTGFVQNGLLVFNAKKKNMYYHSEMNSSNFMLWMEKVFPHLESGSVIVIDNAPYHSSRVDVAPSIEWRKSDIQDWCVTHNAYFEEDYSKSELLEVVAAKEKCARYIFDTRCTELGFTVVRLPPYHSCLNPIEMVWSQIKRHIRKNNKMFTLAEVKNLLREAIDLVTPAQWKNNIDRVVEEENKFWEIDELIEETIDNFISNVNEDSSESDLTDSE